MSAGHGGGLPDYIGGHDRAEDKYGAEAGPYAREHAPYGQQELPYEDPYAAGPGTTGPYAAGPGGTDPYAVGPGGTDPYAVGPEGTDPYARGPRTTDPYAAASHPMGPPRYGAFSPPLPSSNTALAGFVLGLAGLVMCAGLTSPFGIWFSVLGMRETGPEASVPKGGRGLAVAGLVTSLIGLIPLLFVLLYFALIIVGFISAATS